MWDFFKVVLIIFGAIIAYGIFVAFLGWLDERKDIKQKRNKEHLTPKDFLMMKSRKCLNCESLNMHIESNYKLLNVRKSETRTRGLKCYIKFCHDCGHIEFFSTPIIGDSLKTEYNRPLLKSFGHLFLTVAKDFIKFFGNIFSIFKSK